MQLWQRAVQIVAAALATTRLAFGRLKAACCSAGAPSPYAVPHEDDDTVTSAELTADAAEGDGLLEPAWLVHLFTWPSSNSRGTSLFELAPQRPNPVLLPSVPLPPPLLATRRQSVHRASSCWR